MSNRNGSLDDSLFIPSGALSTGYCQKTEYWAKWTFGLTQSGRSCVAYLLGCSNQSWLLEEQMASKDHSRGSGNPGQTNSLPFEKDRKTHFLLLSIPGFVPFSKDSPLGSTERSMCTKCSSNLQPLRHALASAPKNRPCQRSPREENAHGPSCQA